MDTEQLLERLSAAPDEGSSVRAPARLKSKIYSTLVNRVAATGPLLSLSALKQEGAVLCIFENLVASLPVGEHLGSANPCRVCHARVMGERLEHAPIFWPGCPYSKFHND